METIIVKPQTEGELKEVLRLLRSMKIKAELFKDRTKDEVLSSIEKGAKSAASYVKGQRELKSAKEFLNEL